MKQALILLIFLFSASEVLAQESQPPPEEDWIETDRPDNTDSPMVIDKGLFQFESGILFRRDTEDHLQKTELLYPRTLIRYGLFRFMELRLAGDHRREETKPVDPEGEPVKSRGVNAFTLGTKINFYEGKGLVPSIGTILNVTLPFLSPYAPLNLAPAARLALGHELTESMSLQYNVGWERAWEEGQVQSQGVFTAMLDKKFTKRFSAFTEVFGEKPFGEKASYFFDAGLLFRPRYNLQFDVWAGKGLTNASTDFFVGTGFGLRLPR